MNVKMVRLTNNEEVMGEVSYNKKANTYSISGGAVVVPVGEGKMAIVPWLPHSEDNEIEVSADKVMFVFNPLKDLANEYNSRFGNGLVVPTGGEPGGIPNLRLTDA